MSKETLNDRFNTPKEKRLDHTYLDILNGYNLAKAESALNSLFNADDHIGRLRPAAIPNTEGINRTVPMNRIKEIKYAISAAAKLIKALEKSVREYGPGESCPFERQVSRARRLEANRRASNIAPGYGFRRPASPPRTRFLRRGRRGA